MSLARILVLSDPVFVLYRLKKLEKKADFYGFSSFKAVLLSGDKQLIIRTSEIQDWCISSSFQKLQIINLIQRDKILLVTPGIELEPFA